MKYPILSALITELLSIASDDALSETVNELGTKIETKIEQAEREPDDAARSKAHQEALALEKELAAATPEPKSKAKSEPNPVEPVSEKNWYEVVCSVGTARMCFGKSFGELAGHGAKLATAKRNIEYLAKWFAEKPAATDDDRRSFAAYEFAAASVAKRGNAAPEAPPVTTEPESKGDTAAVEEKPASEAGFTIKDWKLVMVPFDVKFTNKPEESITEGDTLGTMTDKQLKFLLVNRVNNPAKFDPKTKAELIFKAGLMLACEEKGIAA